MSIVQTDRPMPAEVTDVAHPAGELPGEVHAGETVVACRITTLSASGVELVVDGVSDPLPAEGTLRIPSLGIYRVRRLWRTGTRAAYVFDLTEFGRRALDALIRDRLPEVPAALRPRRAASGRHARVAPSAAPACARPASGQARRNTTASRRARR